MAARPVASRFAIDVGRAQLVERDGHRVTVREVDVDDGMVPPPGEELFRFATVSDVHVGLDRVGRLPRVVDVDRHLEPPGERCLRAAVREAVGWGAQLLVAKGDLTQHGDTGELQRALDILSAHGLPVLATVGNHEVKRGAQPLAATFAAAGVPVAADGVLAHDVAGLRLVLFDSTIHGSHRGSYARHQADVADAAAGAPSPVLVLTHHHPQPLPVPHHWPPGIPSPQADRFLDALARANPRAWLSTGHTHRHRRRDRRGVVITEVGSTHDHPGTWAGYVVHEAGLRQVVRRIADPDAVRWLERTGRTALGIWSRWAPGTIEDRCVSHTWEAT